MTNLHDRSARITGWLVSFVVVAAVYFASARLGLLLASAHGSVSPVWPATGVAIAALLIGGLRLSPAIALGAFAANAVTPVPLPAAVGIAIGNTLEAVAGAWLVGWCAAACRRREIEHLAEPAAFGLAAVAAPVISATGGVATLHAAGLVQEAMVGVLWGTWWVGDALGALMVAPLLVSAAAALRRRPLCTLRGLATGLAVAIAGAVVCAGIFFQPNGGRFLFAIFPVLLLAGAWLPAFGVSVVAMLISSLGIIAAAFGYGPFVGGSLNEDLLHLQLFLTSVATAALLLPAFRVTENWLTASGLLLVGWALSGWLFASLHRDRLREDAARFDTLVSETTSRIQQRLTTYEESLRGGAGLFIAAKSVGRAEWRVFVESLRLPERYPGVQALAAVFPVRTEDLPAFTAAMRADGAPEFHVHDVSNGAPHPAEPARNEHYVIAYVEPHATNAAALGLDLASETHRRRAAEEARDTGQPRMTRRITLVQDERGRAGFLFFVPLYRPGAALRTVEERRAAFAGWVDAAFITQSFLTGVLGTGPGELEIRLFEGDAPARENLLYASPGPHAGRIERLTALEVAGQHFTIGWARGAAFKRSGPSAAVWAGVSSALVSLVMVGLVVSLHSVSRRAHRLAAARTEELAASEERFRLLTENVQDYAIFALDVDGNVVTWNVGAERITGWASGEIIGRAFALFFPPGAATERTPENLLAMARQRGRAEHEGWRLRKDGSRFWANVVLSALHNRQGQLVGFAHIGRDMSERKQLEESLALARDEAVAASRLKSQFLATMSHEIRTPMNGVIGMIGLLLDTSLTGEQRVMGRTIQQSADSLLTIINEILDFSKIEAGKLRLEPADFDLRQLIEDTVALLALRSEEKQLELACDCDPALSRPLRGDAGRIRQILTNLVGNALKFTERGEVVLSARLLQSTSLRTKVRIAVSDTGIGIPADASAWLFEPFRQADGTATRRFGGTGLGLAISRQLVELMGGKIGYENNPGGGATFWFELELEHGMPVSSDPQAELPAGVRMLVVDDNETNRRIVMGQLQHAGLAAEAVGDGQAALERLGQAAAFGTPFHLVLLDWHMPGMSGIDLALQIRSEPALAATPLVMLSSAGSLDDVPTAARIGFDAFLVKPVRASQLCRCLARVLSRPEKATAPAATAAAPAGFVATPQLHLLVVEDNLANQMVARMLFEKMGYRVSLASDGQEALVLLGREQFDAVVMDCQMPVLDGYETARRIRSGQVPGVNPRVLIIALTAHALPEDRMKCISAGMDEYMAKPVRPQVVIETFIRCGLVKPVGPAVAAWSERAQSVARISGLDAAAQ